jgi:hypothetical protein
VSVPFRRLWIIQGLPTRPGPLKPGHCISLMCGYRIQRGRRRLIWDDHQPTSLTQECMSGGVFEDGIANYDPDNQEFFDEALNNLFGGKKAKTLKQPLRTIINKVKESALDYVNRVRAHRFFAAYKRVYHTQGRSNFCGTRQNKVPHEDFILLTCGHMSCRSHCSGEECPVEGCNAACALNHLLTPIGVRGNVTVPFFPQSRKVMRLSHEWLNARSAPDLAEKQNHSTGMIVTHS